MSEVYSGGQSSKMKPREILKKLKKAQSSEISDLLKHLSATIGRKTSSQKLLRNLVENKVVPILTKTLISCKDRFEIIAVSMVEILINLSACEDSTHNAED